MISHIAPSGKGKKENNEKYKQKEHKRRLRYFNSFDKILNFTWITIAALICFLNQNSLRAAIPRIPV